nr:MAG TPA: hypothetical protein [Caudoviricetes sp.]
MITINLILLVIIYTHYSLICRSSLLLQLVLAFYI